MSCWIAASPKHPNEPLYCDFNGYVHISIHIWSKLIIIEAEVVKDWTSTENCGEHYTYKTSVLQQIEWVPKHCCVCIVPCFLDGWVVDFMELKSNSLYYAALEAETN